MMSCRRATTALVRSRSPRHDLNTWMRYAQRRFAMDQVQPENLRRSALFVPGSSVKHMRKARTLPCDVVILDLEDAVSPTSKDVAREQVRELLEEDEPFAAKEVIVRVNALDSPWGRLDVSHLAELDNISAFLLPKVEASEHVRELVSALSRAGGQNDRVWCMIETPRGVLRAETIAAESPEVECLVTGTEDLSKALQARPRADRKHVMHSLAHIVCVARAYGLTCLDGVHISLQADDEFRRVSMEGRDMGFDGKCLIHPSTIAACNEAFSPSKEDVEFAKRVVEASESSPKDDGVIVVDGRLVEDLHVAQSRRILVQAHLAGQLNYGD